jgi:hypothetical protein
MDTVRGDEDDIHHEIYAKSGAQHHQRLELPCGRPVIREKKTGHAEERDHEPIKNDQPKARYAVPHPKRDENGGRTQRDADNQTGHCLEWIGVMDGKHPKGDIAGPHEKKDEEDKGAGKAGVVTGMSVGIHRQVRLRQFVYGLGAAVNSKI